MLTSLITLRFVSAYFAKEMLNFELTKRALTYAGRQLSTYINQIDPNQMETPTTDATEPKSTEYLVHNWLEALFAWFQMVILWHDPFISLCTVSGLFTSFLLLTYFAPRFYATIMIAIFVYNLTKVWFKHIWPEIRVPPKEEQEEESRLDVDRWTYLHPHVMTLAELNKLASNLKKNSEHHVQTLLLFRRQRPVTFCLAICLTLSCTAFIGNNINGSTIIFCITTALVLAPGIYLYLIPRVAKEYLKHKFNSSNFLLSSQVPLGNDETIESESLSPSSSSSSSPQLSLFERLKRNSFIAYQQESNLETKTTIHRSESEAMKVPMVEDQSSRIKTAQDIVQEESEDVLAPGQSLKGSEDLSSNESTSLIDLDEDQQDGFVML